MKKENSLHKHLDEFFKIAEEADLTVEQIKFLHDLCDAHLSWGKTIHMMSAASEFRLMTQGWISEVNYELSDKALALLDKLENLLKS